MKKTASFIILLILVQNTVLAQFYVQGTIKDKASHETLPGVSIRISNTLIGTSTNSYGFFSLKLPKGNYQLIISYIGYNNIVKEIELNTNLEVDLEMQQQTLNLTGVEIIAKNDQFSKSKDYGLNRMDIKTVQSLPALGCVTDVMKTIQLMPGINTTVDGNSSIFVRGGSTDQNLILLDNAPIYNPAHCLGFFSVFNTDALKSFDIYKSGFPSRFGGRLSSVVDITMKEGNMKRYSGMLDLGLISSYFGFEGPIVKEKSSFFISGRYSYAGFTLNTFGKIGKNLKIYGLNNFNDNNDIAFWDIYFKNNYILNKKNHLYLSFYTGHDKFFAFNLYRQNELNWGNSAGSIRLTHLFNNSLFMNSIVYGSKYNYQQLNNDGVNQFLWTASIYETGTKHSFDWTVNTYHKVQMGFDLNYQHFSPGSIIWSDTTNMSNETSLGEKNTLNTAIYITDHYVMNKYLNIEAGLRINSYSAIGSDISYLFDENNEFIIDTIVTKTGSFVKTYWSVEPRINVNLNLNPSNSITLNFSRTSQNLHLLKNSSIGLPTDIWLPSGKTIDPQKCNIYAIAYHTQINKRFKASLEFYHKDYFDIIDFRDNADLKMNPYVEMQILKGKGKSKGMEILLEKQDNRLHGWIGYSLAETKYKIPGINNGDYYNAPQNITHSLSIALSFQLSEKWFVSADYKYASGSYITVPDGSYLVNNQLVYHYSDRNSYKLPDYHRVDLAIKYVKQSKLLKKEFYLSIYNVLNKKNPYYVDFAPDNSINSSYSVTTKAYYLYLFGLIPTLGCSFKF
jgi:outer membrane cobalamin receptor